MLPKIYSHFLSVSLCNETSLGTVYKTRNKCVNAPSRSHERNSLKMFNPVSKLLLSKILRLNVCCNRNRLQENRMKLNLHCCIKLRNEDRQSSSSSTFCLHYPYPNPKMRIKRIHARVPPQAAPSE